MYKAKNFDDALDKAEALLADGGLRSYIFFVDNAVNERKIAISSQQE